MTLWQWVILRDASDHLPLRGAAERWGQLIRPLKAGRLMLTPLSSLVLWGRNMRLFLLAVGVTLAVPALAAEPDKAKSTTVEHLRLIGLSLNAHVDATGWLPLPASRDAAEKPLLSWRVHLLPYLGEKALYEEFHLKEAWDSEHNQKLVAKMPTVFENPRVPEVKAGCTTFVFPVAPGAMFEVDKRTRLSDVLDGISQTLMVLEVDAERAVPWTKPADLAWDSRKPAAGLYFDEKGHSLSLLGDGVNLVMFPKAIGDEMLARYILRSDLKGVEGLLEVE